MRTFVCSIFLSILFLAQILSARTFTSIRGESIEAEMASVTQDQVRLQLSDKRVITIPFADFSESDRTFIENWVIADAQKRDGVFRVRLQSFRKNNETDKGIITTRTWDEGYRVTLTNLTTRDLGDMTLQYCLYKFNAEFGGRATGKGTISQETGSIKIPGVRSRNDCALETKTLRLNASKLHSDWDWAGGGKRRSADDIEGIWLKVYYKGNLIFEHNSCPEASKEHGWPDSKLPPPKN